MNEATIWSFLKTQGMTDAGAAGLMGNLDPESGLNPKNLQNSFEDKLGYTDETYTEAVDSGKYTNFVNDKAGYGLAQWTYWSRKQNLLNHAKNTGRSIGDLTMQLEFLVMELISYGLMNTLQTATSVREASDIILLQFEKPGSVGPNATEEQRKATCDKRAAIAQRYYDQFATSKGDGSTMKYTSTNPPIQCYMRQSTWYNGAKTVTPKGVLVHSTGANNTTLKRYVQPDDNAADRDEMIALIGKNSYNNDWNHIYREAGVHAWVGKLANGEVASVQVGPWNKEAWGCGAGKYGSCNQGWIQYEICEDGLADKTYFDKVYREAVELTAYLCKLYNLDPHGTVTHCGVKNVPVILCHQDSYQYGLGCNHGDVLHWFHKFGKCMDDFRNDVAALMNESSGTTVEPAPADPGNTSSFKAYTVNVKVTGLNIRSGPGTNYPSNGCIEPGVYTIVEESAGQGASMWGKLKSGAGWISLDFEEKPDQADTSDDTKTDTVEEENDMVYYNNLDDIPDYYRDTIKKLVDANALRGTGNGLNVSEDVCRIMTVLDRLGKLD